MIMRKRYCSSRVRNMRRRFTDQAIHDDVAQPQQESGPSKIVVLALACEALFGESSVDS